MLNHAVFIGRLVRDPEMKYTEGGKAFATYRFAVDRAKNEADFFDGVAFEKNAEVMANYGKKGRLVALVGRMASRTVEGKNGKVEKVGFVAERVRFLDRGDASNTDTADDPFQGE